MQNAGEGRILRSEYVVGVHLLRFDLDMLLLQSIHLAADHLDLLDVTGDCSRVVVSRNRYAATYSPHCPYRQSKQSHNDTRPWKLVVEKTLWRRRCWRRCMPWRCAQRAGGITIVYSLVLSYSTLRWLSLSNSARTESSSSFSRWLGAPTGGTTPRGG